MSHKSHCLACNCQRLKSGTKQQSENKFFPDSESNHQSNCRLYFLSPQRYEYKQEINICRRVDIHPVGNSVFMPLIEFLKEVKHDPLFLIIAGISVQRKKITITFSANCPTRRKQVQHFHSQNPAILLCSLNENKVYES